MVCFSNFTAFDHFNFISQSCAASSCFALTRFAGLPSFVTRSRVPFEASAEEGQPLYYVYLIQSVSAQGERYLGMTSDLKQRLQEHNAGKSSHTSKFRPWKLRRISRLRIGPKQELSSVISNPVRATYSLVSTYGNALRSFNQGGSTNPWRLQHRPVLIHGQLESSAS